MAPYGIKLTLCQWWILGTFSPVTKWPHSVSWSRLEFFLMQQTEFIPGLIGIFIAFAAISLPYLGLWWEMCSGTVFYGNSENGNDPTDFSSSFRCSFYYMVPFSLQVLRHQVSQQALLISSFVPWLISRMTWICILGIQWNLGILLNDGSSALAAEAILKGSFQT